MTGSTKPKIERRAKARHQAQIQLQVQFDARLASVSTRDVCMSGLSCYLPEPLSLFTKYQFRLFIPTGDGKVEEIEGDGIVVRVEEVEIDGQNVFQTAFFFQHLEEGQLMALGSFLDNSASTVS